jgi:hypothetical protein
VGELGPAQRRGAASQRVCEPCLRSRARKGLKETRSTATIPFCLCATRRSLKRRGLAFCQSISDDQSNHVCLWKMYVDQLLPLQGKVILRAACCDVDVPPPTQRLDKEKEIGRAFTVILISIPSRLSRPGWQGLPRLIDQLHRTFINTDLRTPPIIRLSIQIQHILPVPDKVRTYARTAPFFTLPRLEVVFLVPGVQFHLRPPQPVGVRPDDQPVIASSSVSALQVVCYTRVRLKRLPVCHPTCSVSLGASVP